MTCDEGPGKVSADPHQSPGEPLSGPSAYQPDIGGVYAIVCLPQKVTWTERGTL